MVHNWNYYDSYCPNVETYRCSICSQYQDTDGGPPCETECPGGNRKTEYCTNTSTKSQADIDIDNLHYAVAKSLTEVRAYKNHIEELRCLIDCMLKSCTESNYNEFCVNLDTIDLKFDYKRKVKKCSD